MIVVLNLPLHFVVSTSAEVPLPQEDQVIKIILIFFGMLFTLEASTPTCLSLGLSLEG